MHKAVSAPTSHFNFIADTGASGHYLPQSFLTLLHNVRPHTSLKVLLPDGSTIFSSHIGLLPFAQFPQQACVAFIFPHLTHALLSIAMFCRHGYRAVFTDTSVSITSATDPTPLLAGSRSPSNLWIVPVPPAPPVVLPPPSASPSFLCNVYAPHSLIH